MARRFTPPWTAELSPADSSSRTRPAKLLPMSTRARRQADTAKVLMMDEARRIASNIAKLPTLLPRKE